MPNVNVTYQDMRDAGTRLRNGKNDMEQQLNALKKTVDALVTGGYVTDQSSKAFQSSYDEFNKGVTETLRGLDGMSTYLDKAAQAFQEADQQLAQSLKG
jgi:WXG100 family type VII secretion target